MAHEIIKDYDRTVTDIRKFMDELRDMEYQLISEKEALMCSEEKDAEVSDETITKLKNVQESIEEFRRRKANPSLATSSAAYTPTNASSHVEVRASSEVDVDHISIMGNDESESSHDPNPQIRSLPTFKKNRQILDSDDNMDRNTLKNCLEENNSNHNQPANTSSNKKGTIKTALNNLEETRIDDEFGSLSSLDIFGESASPEIIWDDEPSTSVINRNRKLQKNVAIKNEIEEENSQVKMPRVIESSDEEKSLGNDSEASVVDDEDLELEAAIRAENSKSKKDPKKQSLSKKNQKNKVNEDEDEDDDIDSILKSAKSALKDGKKKSGLDLEEGPIAEEEDSDDRTDLNLEESSSPDKGKKKSSKINESAFSNTQRHLGGSPSPKSRSSDKLASKEKTQDSEEDIETNNESNNAPKKKKKRRDKDLDKLLKNADALVENSEEDEDKPRRKNRTTSSKRKRRFVDSESDADEKNSEKDSEDEDSQNDRSARQRVIIDSSGEETPTQKEKKKGTVKKIMGRDKLAQGTLDAEKAEKERRKRLEQKQKEFNGIELAEGIDLETALTGSQAVPKLKSVVLDPDRESDLPVPVAVHPELVSVLKPHQAKGIQFMYDSAFESVMRLKEEGGGGILAHCMGLGKTLQVITFLHTTMTHPKVGKKAKRALVVVPKNVVLNWFKEFAKWLERDGSSIGSDLEILELDSVKTYNDRIHVLRQWFNSEVPCILIIGYDMFRILTHDEDDMKKKRGPPKKKPVNGKNKKLERMKEDFRKYLQDPGPDIVVCDEAHKLKNDESALSKAMVKIKTKRRLCLTGTPLQNNLMEYHCMVNFVKPGLLGTKAEFSNRFANIINKGRLKDATSLEVKFMKRRCHVLYKHLEKCVDRKDYTVLQEAIPPKQEYVINVRLTPKQCTMYRYFLEGVARDGGHLSRRLLPDYHVLSRVWTHPYQLVIHDQKMEKERMLKEDADAEEDFIDDRSGSGSGSENEDDEVVQSDHDSDIMILDSDGEQENNGRKSPTAKAARKSRRLEGEKPEMEGRDTETPPEYYGWAFEAGLVENADQYNFELSNKLILLTAILKKCEEIGDKILVFSQSLESLSLIRKMLEFYDSTGQWFNDGHEACKAAGEQWGWKQGKDFMVIDGSVQSVQRDAVQTKFNNPANLRARLMLISTRAGSLGTNMVAANRVIIFDACWNPSHDTQSLFRVYRFGQTKPVYIYRFIAQGTMEERIYKRQVTKESTSMRVVDEAQIQRHYDGHDLEELYRFNPSELDPLSTESRPAFAPPKDRLLADVLLSNPNSVVDYFQHDTLFAHVEEEKLSEEELKEAWNDYEREKVNPRGFAVANYNQYLLQQQQQQLERIHGMQQLRAALATDPIYMSTFSVMQMSDDVAVQVTYLKKSLEDLLPKIPVLLRGGIDEFNSFFLNFITQATTQKHNATWLLNKSISTFRTVIKMVKNIPECKQAILNLYHVTPQYFDPTEALPT